jgi:lipoprotein-anchoring transpeptidase ErfK/SrfK
MTSRAELYQHALQKARHAYSQGDRKETRLWAQRAAALAPDQEEPWLWLAAVASPSSSLTYLKRALQINPQSVRARKGMHWAIQRLRASSPPRVAVHEIAAPATLPKPVEARPARSSRTILFLITTIFTLLAVLVVWPGPSILELAGVSAFPGRNHFLVAQVKVDKATLTPIPTDTPTPLPTDTPTPTVTPTPTETPTPLPTDTPAPTNTPEPTEDPNLKNMPNVGNNERWVDVDLTLQRAYAYEGKHLERKFIVSTGTWLHPTVTGQYNIYVKYVSAPMYGPDYYLPGVPYIMYFYKGYALHGTYWHNNFGTPMSHGCVNLTIEDAEWLFNWTDIGTLVNIHY